MGMANVRLNVRNWSAADIGADTAGLTLNRCTAPASGCQGLTSRCSVTPGECSSRGQSFAALIVRRMVGRSTPRCTSTRQGYAPAPQRAPRLKSARTPRDAEQSWVSKTQIVGLFGITTVHFVPAVFSGMCCRNSVARFGAFCFSSPLTHAEKDSRQIDTGPRRCQSSSRTYALYSHARTRRHSGPCFSLRAERRTLRVLVRRRTIDRPGKHLAPAGCDARWADADDYRLAANLARFARSWLAATSHDHDSRPDVCHRRTSDAAAERERSARLRRTSRPFMNKDVPGRRPEGGPVDSCPRAALIAMATGLPVLRTLCIHHESMNHGELRNV